MGFRPLLPTLPSASSTSASIWPKTKKPPKDPHVLSPPAHHDLSKDPEAESRKYWSDLSTYDRQVLITAVELELERLLDNVEMWLPTRIRAINNQSVEISMTVFPSQMDKISAKLVSREMVTAEERVQASVAQDILSEIAEDLDD